jgi:hypothetical protein
VILEVIDSVVREVFVVGCAFYHAASIVDSVSNATGRNVLIRILLERERALQNADRETSLDLISHSGRVSILTSESPSGTP